MSSHHRSRQIVLSVDGMTCPTCEQTLERVVGRLPGVRSVRADHRMGSVEVGADESLGLDALERAVHDAGYDLSGAVP